MCDKLRRKHRKYIKTRDENIEKASFLFVFLEQCNWTHILSEKRRKREREEKALWRVFLLTTPSPRFSLYIALREKISVFPSSWCSVFDQERSPCHCVCCEIAFWIKVKASFVRRFIFTLIKLHAWKKFHRCKFLEGKKILVWTFFAMQSLGKYWRSLHGARPEKGRGNFSIFLYRWKFSFTTPSNLCVRLWAAGLFPLEIFQCRFSSFWEW